MKNKKGALTQKQIITIIILIISFVIILAFLLMLNLKGEIDKEACRNSVSMRGLLPYFKDSISLKCKTQDVCLSMGAGCEEPVDETINVGKREEVIKELVNLLADCWWMMGEGKADYGSSGDCAICYKVYFDVGIYETLTYDELYNYMANNKISDKSMSYLFYLYKVNNIDSIPSSSRRTGDMNLNEEYAVVTKIKEKGNHIPPNLVKFSSKDLGIEGKYPGVKGFGCSKFVMEV